MGSEDSGEKDTGIQDSFQIIYIMVLGLKKTKRIIKSLKPNIG